MNLREIMKKLQLDVKSGNEALESEVTGGYVSDLMSDVLANAQEGDLWVTLQTHQNTIAVASMKGLAGVVLVGSREPEEDTLQKATEEGIPLFVTPLPAFELVGRLYEVGLSGLRR